MYFKLFKPQNWRKRSAEARRRNCAVLPQAFPIKPPTASQNVLEQFRRCGRGILKGAAFRQRPFVTDDEIVCGYQRIFCLDCAV